MDFSNFWVQQNNGNKENLGEIKHGIRKDHIDKKYQNLFDIYDTNRNGTLEEEEISNIFTNLKNVAGGDNIFDAVENTQVTSLFTSKGVENTDFMGFLESISKESKKIISFEKTKLSDGGKRIKTSYADGRILTSDYYPNGNWKSNKLEVDPRKYVVFKTDSGILLKVSYSKQKQEDGKNVTYYNITAINNAGKTLSIDEIANALNVQRCGDNVIELDTVLEMGENKIKFLIPGEEIAVSPTETEATETSKLINAKDVDTTVQNEYSIKYLLDLIGVDVNSPDGKKIQERLSYFDRDTLKKLGDGKEIKELLADNDLAPTFDNLSNVLEIIYGVTLRDEEELEANKAEHERLITQIQAVNMMSNLYEMIAEWNDQYTDGLGLFGMGSEGIGYVLNKLGIDGENHYQLADSCREYAQKASKLKPLNSKDFQEEFKNITKINFDEKAFNKLFSIVEANKATNEKGELTQEYKDAILKACNIVADNPNDDVLLQVTNGLGEALLMVMTLGIASEAEGGLVLARTAMSTFGKLGTQIASKQAGNKLLQGALRYSGKAVSLLGPAITEGTKMATYTALTGTATNITNRIVKSDSEENSLEKFVQTEGQVLEAAKGSFGFGAFAGVFGATVTPKVVNAVSKTSSKVIKSLSENFAKGSVDATEVYSKVLEKSIPTKLGEAAAFATDVVGFTGFETVLTLVNNMDGFPDKVSVEDVANLIKEEFKEQGYSLGQIKVISHLVMWMSGSRSARMNSANYLKENLPQLKGVKVEETNGKYNIKLADGRTIECKNANEMISSLHLMVRGQTAFSAKFDKKAETQGAKVAEKQTKVETETVENKVENTELTDAKTSKVEGNVETNEPLTLSQRIEKASTQEEFDAIAIEILATEDITERVNLSTKYDKYCHDWKQKQLEKKYPKAAKFAQDNNLQIDDIMQLNNALEGFGDSSDALTEEQSKLLIELLKNRPNEIFNGYTLNEFIRNIKPENYEKVIKYSDFFKKQVQLNKIVTSASDENSREMLDFLTSESYMQELKQNSAGKYQNEILNMLDVKSMDNILFVQLTQKGLSKADFLNGVKKMSKSTFKLAYDRPNQYLSGIDLKYSTPVDGKFPDLPTEELRAERKGIIQFFTSNMGKLCRTLKYVDTDTVSHMMDKRTNLFEQSLDNLDQLSDENFELLSKLLTCKSETSGKQVSPKEKIQLCQIVEIYQMAKLDMSLLKDAMNKGTININKAKQLIQNEVLKMAGVDLNDSRINTNNKKFNEEYAYLTLNTSNINSNYEEGVRRNLFSSLNSWRNSPDELNAVIKQTEEQYKTYRDRISEEQAKFYEDFINMLKNIDKYSDEQFYDIVIDSIRLALRENKRSEELYTVIKEAALGNFNNYIIDESNPCGQANAKTKLFFEDEGLNFEKWLNPEIEDIQLEVAGKKMSIKMWDRNPQEDLFIGNKTTCCTAIGTGGNGGATPIYLLNQSYNVVELYDAEGNVVGMSRVFMGKVDGQHKLIMDNIELNNTYIKGMTDEQKAQIRDGFFEYMNKYAEEVTGDKDAQVYFYSKDIHVPSNDLEKVSEKTDFVGALSTKSVYVNSAGCSWINPEKLNEVGKIEWLVVPKKTEEVKTAENSAKTKEINAKEFKQKFSSILDETGKPVFSDFTINKFVEKYGVENGSKLTQLYETISQKFPNNSQTSIDLFKTIVENETFVNSKDFSIVEKVLNQFELTTETTEQISDFFTNLTNDRLEMSNLLFDIISRDKNPSTEFGIETDFESFNHYIQSTENYNLSGIKRIAELTDENGNYILNSKNVAQRFAYSQLAACDDLSNTDIINIINLAPTLPRIKGVKGKDALARPENKALRAELRDIANEKNPETRDDRLTLFGLKQKINNIQDKNLKSWVKKTLNNLQGNSAKNNFIETITELLDNKSFSDSRVNTQIYKCIEEISKNYEDKTFVESKINEIKKLASINDTFAGKSSSLGGENSLDDMIQTIKIMKSEDEAAAFLKNAETFEKYLEKYNNDYSQAFKAYQNDFGYVHDKSFIDYTYTKRTTELKDYMINNIPKLREELAQLKQEYQKDNNFKTKTKIDELEKKLSAIDGMYEETYLSTVPKECREILKRINSEYGIKVFLAHDIDPSEVNYIYNELLEWQKAGRGKVKYPPVLDLSRANSNFAIKENTSGFYSTADHSISIRGRHTATYALRHEMMHANDPEVVGGADIREIKNDKGEEIDTIDFLDIKNDKRYYNELVNAGIESEHADYAYTNFAEFIAVSAEGNFEKYSPEFKEFLVKIGMPKWVFNMKPTETLNHAQNIYTQADVNWEYSLYQNKLISINSQKLFNNTSMHAKEVANDYTVFEGINGEVTSRVKNFEGVNEKIYREIKRVDKEIEEWISRQKDPQKLAVYNAKMKAKGKDAVKFEEIPSKINGLQTKRANLFSDYDTVHDTVIDTFGTRLVMDDCSPEGVQKVVDKIIEQVDKGEIEILALDNYYGTNGTPYFSKVQVEAIRQHCLAKGQKVEINISEKSSGYTTCQMNIKHKNGVISEFQIRGAEINKQAEVEHLYYDFCQNKNPITKNPALEPVLSPLKDVVENLKRPENAKLKKAYEGYLTECYKKARAIEENKPYKEPVFPFGLNPILKIENLEQIHTEVEKIKNK